MTKAAELDANVVQDNHPDRISDCPRPLTDHTDYEERPAVSLERHVGLSECHRIVHLMTAIDEPTDTSILLGKITYPGASDIIETTIANIPAQLRRGLRNIGTEVRLAS